jgi:hypothetical protein
MKTITDWARSFRVNDKPWLLLGKGPTFALFDPGMADSFFLMGLNHVSGGRLVTLAHFIDIDAFLDCAGEPLAGAGWVVMPWHPHESFRPSEKTLADYARDIPALGDLLDSGRLLTYNLSTSGGLDPLPGAPRLEARFFSAEAGLDVLAECGARVVRSLGVDGGTAYSPQFSSGTRLANGQPTFDLQFAGMARTIRRTGVEYGPLHADCPARVFVGADETQELPFRVLEYSIRKHASVSVECRRIDNSGLRIPDAPANRSRTGFSFSRFRIPALCGYSGRAIYVDADMQVFSDLLDLWSRPFDGASVLYAEHDGSDGRIPQYSVLLLDCAALDWDADRIIRDLDQGRFTYEALMHDFGIVPPEKKKPALPAAWNSLELYAPGETRLLHYTDMPRQPWVSPANPNRDLWLGDLREAIGEGFISREFLFDQVARGHVSPELPEWLGMESASRPRKRKNGWVPPYKRPSPAAAPSVGPSSGTFWSRIVGHLKNASGR